MSQLKHPATAQMVHDRTLGLQAPSVHLRVPGQKPSMTPALHLLIGGGGGQCLRSQEPPRRGMGEQGRLSRAAQLGVPGCWAAHPCLPRLLPAAGPHAHKRTQARTRPRKLGGRLPGRPGYPGSAARTGSGKTTSALEAAGEQAPSGAYIINGPTPRLPSGAAARPRVA